MKDTPGTVYLIHFDRPYKHARHYLGWARNLEARLAHHRAGTGAHLIAVIQAAGIGWKVARTWEGGTPRLEERLKGWHKISDACPVCCAERRQARLDSVISGCYPVDVRRR